MLQFDEYKVKLNNLRPGLDELEQALGLEAAQREVDMLESESASDGFWDNLEKAQKVQQRISILRGKLEGQAKRRSQWNDLMALCEMGNEFEDESLIPELEEGYSKLEEEVEEAKLTTLLTGEYDSANAILTFHAGAGGTEAQDWTQMLYRMYTRWAERHGFTYQVMDYLDGDEAGIKSATIMIEGENAYGFLRSEHGVHRLVRVSPFDAAGRRHTSFASVDVIPDAGNDIQLDIKESDLRFDIFRSSGPGGQSVNTTSSAVRVTHLPTGISAQCQNEKSQHHNKETALRVLRARLYNLELQKREAERQAEYAGKDAIAFGSQIRTYTLQPYRLVKDHRTGSESGDVDAVLDGQIDQFQHDYLLYRHEQQR